jgi:hypothetical protein
MQAPAYKPKVQAIWFPFFQSEYAYLPEDKGERTKKTITVYTCQSYDFIAHEMGHAILDSFKPGYGSSAVSESFADLTAIFTLLGQMDMVEEVISSSKANLRTPTFLNVIAERYGILLHSERGTPGEHQGLRDALNLHRASDRFSHSHESSQVLTGAVYEIISELFHDHMVVNQYDPAESLYRVGRHMTQMVLLAYSGVPVESATFKAIAMEMMTHEERPRWRNIMRWVFKKREIV